MSVAAAQAAAFYREVAETGRLCAIRDKGGYPAPSGADGNRAMPFWSSRSRAEKIIASVPAYAGFEVEEIAWTEFVQRWAPGLVKDGLVAGVNWSGATAKGYDVAPFDVVANVEAIRSRP